MNEFLTILQKTGVWIWTQKEKMVLVILLCVFGFRVYQVVSGPPPAPPEDKTTRQAPEDDPELPGPRKARAPKVNYQSLVQRNPFSVYGVSLGGPDSRDGEERIDLTLVRIVPWHDGSHRAEMVSSRDPRARRYEEGEPFEGYRVETIDPVANTVTVYSSEHERSFTLEAQQE
jgi:hypothetical protein